MRLILICGPFGSGTSAIAGMLERLGVTGFGPYFKTDDERTATSYELAPFRDLLRTLVAEGTLSPAPDVDVKAELVKFRDRIARGEFGPLHADSNHPIFLKHPLAAFVIPRLCEVFETRLIYALRPLRDIEATRERRKWAEQYGAKGAQVIYSHMFSSLINYTFPTFVVRYAQLTASPEEHAHKFAGFAGVRATPDAIKSAAEFIRQPPTASAG